MKTSLNGTRYVVGATVFGLLLFGAATASADNEVDEDFDASIEVLENLAIEEDTQLDFGRVGMPTEGTAIFELAGLEGTSEVSVEDGGDNDDAFEAGGAAVGEYTVTGPPDEEITVSANADNFDAEVQFPEQWIEGEEDGDHTFDMGDDGTETIHIGGEVHVTSDADADTYETDLEVTVSYD